MNEVSGELRFDISRWTENKSGSIYVDINAISHQSS